MLWQILCYDNQSTVEPVLMKNAMVDQSTIEVDQSTIKVDQSTIEVDQSTIEPALITNALVDTML